MFATSVTKIFFYITAAEKGDIGGYREVIYCLGCAGDYENIKMAEWLTFESVNLNTIDEVISEFCKACENYKEYNQKREYLKNKITYFRKHIGVLNEDKTRIKLQKIMLDYCKEFNINIPSNFQSK